MKNNKFDELAKSMAQSVTRRETMKKFGFGITALALGALGLTNKAEAAKPGSRCTSDEQCAGLICYQGRCVSNHMGACRSNGDCKPGLVCRASSLALGGKMCTFPI